MAVQKGSTAMRSQANVDGSFGQSIGAETFGDDTLQLARDSGCDARRRPMANGITSHDQSGESGQSLANQFPFAKTLAVGLSFEHPRVSRREHNSQTSARVGAKGRSPPVEPVIGHRHAV